MFRKLIIAAALLAPTPALAGPVTDTQEWVSLQISGPIKDKIVAMSEVTLRNGDATHGIYQIEPLIALGYKATKNVTLYAGIGDVYNRSSADVVTHETRWFQQANIKFGTIGGGALSSRVRLEERTSEGARDTNLRLRGQIKYVLPFHKGGKTSLAMSHESMVMLNSTDWQGISGYSQMRNFIGIRQNIAKHFDVEGGYLNQYTVRHGVSDKMDHAMALTFVASF